MVNCGSIRNSIGLVAAICAVATVCLLPLTVTPAKAGGIEHTVRITIAAPHVPPYFDWNGKGLEAARIRKALSSTYCSDQIHFAVRPFVQHWRLYAENADVDAVATVPDGEALPGYPTMFYIEYQNGIGYRKGTFPDGIKNIADPSLDGKRIAAFVDAMGILPGLSAKRPKFSSYVENGDQKANSVLLDGNRVDAVISDKRIFEFYNDQVEGLKDATDIGFNPIFPPSPYRMMFRSAALADVFNKGLQQTGKLPARCR